MMKNIHEAFEKIVNELKWMDDITKKRTLHKAQLMRTFVGYPEFIKDQAELDNYYADVFQTILLRHTYYFVGDLINVFYLVRYCRK